MGDLFYTTRGGVVSKRVVYETTSKETLNTHPDSQRISLRLKGKDSVAAGGEPARRVDRTN